MEGGQAELAVTETPEERAKRLGLTSPPAESAADRARRMGIDAETSEPEAGYGERLATTLLKAAQVIPGMKSFEAAAASGPVSHTLGHPDTPGTSYADTREGLEEQTKKLGRGRGMLAEAVASPMMAPAFAARGISALSPAMQGAAYGGVSEAADYDPNETMASRAIRTGAGAAAGGVLAGTGSLVTKLVKAPSGTMGKVAGSIMPRPVQRGMRTWAAAQKAVEPPEIVKPHIRLTEASAPKAEGLIGNDMKSNVLEAVKAREAQQAGHNLPDVVKATERYRTESGALQKRAPNARFDWYAEQAAKRAAERAATDPNDLSGLLQQSLKIVGKTGKMPTRNPFMP